MNNLYLIGMMGAGKTHLGKQLAARLKRPFLDMDQYIANKTGKTPAEWLRHQGEAAFRAEELTALGEVSGLRSTVVATGGGAPISSAARQLLQTGKVVWLDAPVEILFERLQSDVADRPLARNKAQFELLYQQRQALYRSLASPIATNRADDEVLRELTASQEVLNTGGLAPELQVRSTQGTYPVKQVHSLQQAGDWLRGRFPGPFMIVSPPLVYSLYGPALTEGLGDARVQHCLLPDGEEHKNLATVQYLYDQFLSAQLHRSATVIALGGGVTGDTVGFAAATFMRGLPLVQIPTTLLAQVDSSIGGKVGVNLPAGKNLVGSFYPPLASLLATSTLHSLPDAVYRQGLSEIVKCALLASEDQLSWLEAHASLLRKRRADVLHRAIYAANALKARLVEGDEHDRGSRQFLNLGHTLAHALEATLRYRGLEHGDAVAFGLQWALLLSPAHHLLPRVRSLLTELGFALCPPAFDFATAIQYLQRDKKQGARGLTLVLLDEVGAPRLAAADGQAMERALRTLSGASLVAE